MGRFRWLLYGLLGVVATALSVVFTPGTWLNRVISLGLCSVLSAEPAMCSAFAMRGGDRAVATEVPLLAQRDREFFDPPPSEETPPAFGQDPGPDFIRDDFRGASPSSTSIQSPATSDTVEEPTLEFLDKNGCFNRYELSFDTQNILFIKSITTQHPGNSGCRSNQNTPYLTVTALDAQFDELTFSSDNGSAPVTISNLNGDSWTFSFTDETGMRRVETISISDLQSSSKWSPKNDVEALAQASGARKINCRRMRDVHSDCKRGKDVENKIMVVAALASGGGSFLGGIGLAMDKLKDATRGVPARKPIVNLPVAGVGAIGVGIAGIGSAAALANTLMSGMCSIMFGEKYDNFLITSLRQLPEANYWMGRASQQARRRLSSECTVRWTLKMSSWSRSLDGRGVCTPRSGRSTIEVLEITGDLSGEFPWFYSDSGRQIPETFSSVTGQINSSGELTMKALYGLYDMKFSGQDRGDGVIQGQMVGCGGQAGEFLMGPN